MAKEKIRILGVAPYEGLQSMMKKQVVNHPKIELFTVCGDLQEGVELAKNNFHADYDIILSRGGTARLLRTKVNQPVIEISISYYDLLRAISIANQVDGNKAIIGYPNITKNAHLLCTLLQFDIAIYTVNDNSELDSLLEKLKRENYNCIICDTIASIKAKKMGLTAVLITSGTESINQAFLDAIDFYNQMQNLREENQFFREIIKYQKAETVIYTEDLHLYYSSTNNEKHSQLLNHLREYVPEVLNGMKRHMKSIGGILYYIKSNVIKMAGNNYITFYFTSSNAPLTASQMGISFYTRNEVEISYLNSLFSLTGDIENYSSLINQMKLSPKPLMLIGERSAGKNQLCKYVYINSRLQRHPLIEINCELVSSKTWNYLINSYNSPLYGNNNTIYISNIEALNLEKTNELIASISFLCKNNTNSFIFSTNSPKEGLLPEVVSRIIDEFTCLTIKLPSLKERPEKIPVLLNLYLSELNDRKGFDIIRVDDDAIAYMQKYSWPGNFNQFKRIVLQLATTSIDKIIHLKEVKEVLSQEKYTTVTSYGTSVDLSKPLVDIEYEIIRTILKENDGNQSATAKQLGISRSTLWRLLKRTS